MHTTPLIRLSVLVALLGLISAGATAKTADPTDVTIDVEMPSPERATIHSLQAWNGSAARDMRQSLDAYFGTASGDLSAEEVGKIENASEHDLTNHTLPFVRFNGQEPMVLSAEVRLVDAAGMVDSAQSLSVEHVIEVAVPPSADGNGTVEVDSRWNGTMSFVPPEGHVVTSSPDGAVYRFDGPISSDVALSLSYGPEDTAATPTTPTGNETPTPDDDEERAAPTRSAEESTEPTREIPSSASALVAVTLGIAALWFARQQNLRR